MQVENAKNALSLNKIYIKDIFSFLDLLPNSCIDLAIIDPPYNLKVASWDSFKSQKAFLDFSFAWIDKMLPKLKNTASFLFLTLLIIVRCFCTICRAKRIFKTSFAGTKKTG